ncbi:MAG: 30S ribosome-binding factor RbfA [Gemmatimonadaceae bacterium]
MPPHHRRADRVAEAIREEVATWLTEGAGDPRIVGLVTVTGVDVTQDLRHARVFISVMGSEVEQATTFEAIAGLTGFMRSRLAKRLRLRFAPELEFRKDATVEQAGRIERLLAEIRNGKRPDDEKTD